MSQQEKRNECSDDLIKINGLIDRLDVCTSPAKKEIEATQINSILTALKDHASNSEVRRRLSSDQQIKEQQLPGLFNRFCLISIRFSSSLTDFPLFVTVLIQLWNMIFSKLIKSMENEVLSAQEYYATAMSGLSTKPFSTYFTNNTVKDAVQLYVKLFVTLASIAIWADARRMEHLNLSAYTSHKSLHETKYDAVFHNLITFVDSFFFETQAEAEKREIVQTVFSLVVAMTDSKNYLPTTIRLGFPAKLVEWLNMLSNRNDESDPLNAVIVAISNISQLDEGIVALNEACAITALDVSEKALANTLQKSPATLSFYPGIYAMIATTDQLKILPVLTPAMDHLLKKIHEANASPELRSTTAHLYEYLLPLAKLLVNDNMANYLLNNAELGGLDFFIELFHEHDLLSANDLFVKHLIRLALYNILCSLAFHPTVQQELKHNRKFIDAVMEASTLATSTSDATIPPSLRNNLMTVKTAADGILVYLDQFKTSTSSKIDPTSSSKTKIPMISYSHKDADFCRAVVAGLKEQSISVWVDEDGHCLSDDCWEEIAMAIKNASAVLIVVSENYCTKSDSCRVEATYAIKLKIPIIALYIDDKYQAEPWLDIHLTGLHVKFGNKSFAERIVRLAKYITARNNTSEPDSRPRSTVQHASHEVDIVTEGKPKPVLLTSKASEPAMESPVPKTSPHNWSAAEVRSWWCKERTLVPQLCTFYDGEALCIYASLFWSSYQDNPIKHCQQLRERLKHEHRIEFYDDHYANLASSMMWIVKHSENVQRKAASGTVSAACTLS